MSIVARRFAACPACTASEVWTKICALISGDNAEVMKELKAVAGMAAAVITEESPKEAPIVVVGTGPRLRIYCVYGEDACDSDNLNENPINWIPTEDPWHMWLPCLKEDFGWMSETVKKKSSYVSVYDLSSPPEIDRGDVIQTTGKSNFSFDEEAFRQ